MPGIIFSGGKSGLTATFGSGMASAANWKVGSSLNPDVFTTNHTAIPTSYDYLLQTAENSGINPTPITSLSEITTNGIYKVEGNLTVSATTYTFPANKNVIVLVNGGMTIINAARILVPIGSTAIFSVRGNISVSSNVGEPPTTSCNAATHTGCDIEGLYSADGNFLADGAMDCVHGVGAAGADLRLNIAGTVIANAARNGGTFINNRSLCANNSAYPSVTFTERPDFILNYPSFVRKIPRSWQEVAA